MAREKLLDNDNNVNDDDFNELMKCNGLPPLRMKVVQGVEGTLSLARVNGTRLDNNNDKGRVVALQIATTHDMGNLRSMSSRECVVTFLDVVDM